MTSLASHYHDDYEALRTHLQEEHAIFSSRDPETPRAHLCCTAYRNGPGMKSALESVCGKAHVRTAMNNHAFGTYCAIAHLPSASAGDAPFLIHAKARCSPLTHAVKEPLSLVSPASSAPRNASGGADSASAASAAHFGLTLGPSVQDGAKRGLVVTMSPGSLSLDAAEGPRSDDMEGVGGGMEAGRRKGRTRGGAQNRRKFSERQQRRRDEGHSSSDTLRELEKEWRAFWEDAQGVGGVEKLVNLVPWTSGSSSGGGGNRRRDLLADNEAARNEDIRSYGGRAKEFHGGKAAGYRAAFEHVGERMKKGRGRKRETLAEACGWDNLSFSHGHEDVLYLR